MSPKRKKGFDWSEFWMWTGIVAIGTGVQFDLPGLTAVGALLVYVTVFHPVVLRLSARKEE